jgi:hypothetical protein
MQLTLLASVIILVSVFPIERNNPEIRNQRKPPVELWCTGDDLWSQRMCQAFFAAFESSPDFDLQQENKSGNLIVSIPENVGWREVGKRMKISYVVEFSTSDDRVFMTRKGSCWHEEYAKCANQILKEAKVAARKLPR